jgi:hypothetical protein
LVGRSSDGAQSWETRIAATVRRSPQQNVVDCGVQAAALVRSLVAMHRSTPTAAVVVPIAALPKDRRFICEACGVKWFVPAEKAGAPDLDRCESCGGALKVFVAAAEASAG